VLLARFLAGGKPQTGLIEGRTLKAIKGPIYGSGPVITGRRYDLKKVKLLPPCTPTKVIAIGLNYRGHAKELGMPEPKEPLIFMKPPSSVTAPGSDIIYPKRVKRLDYEAELGIVIGKRCRHVRIKDAGGCIFGYTCVNDVTARDLQRRDSQWTRAKSFDTFCPVGPVINTGFDPRAKEIRLLLNGEEKQYSNTANMIFDPHRLVSFISGICTLMPGDIIATGTPAGIGPMRPGDTVEVRIEGIGSLKNRVARSRI
jgi:2-keto-4-pentenoate hydratase/2-oxohepta-3-ene-1,7-dioic acid hydratase in catechol pathway